MEMFLGMPEEEAYSYMARRGEDENVGGKFKATTVWNPPNEGATNESGFSAIPSGFRNLFEFKVFGEEAFFWLSDKRDIPYTEEADPSPMFRNIYTIYNWFWRGFWDYEMDSPKGPGMSVRCVKD